MRLPLVIFFFASINSFGQIKEFSWLIGTWEEDGKSSYEVWKEDNGSLSAESYKMKDGNKIVSEEIKLVKRRNDFYYVPDVAGPQGPIDFKIASFNEMGFVAENAKHDFPTMISYERKDENHFVAMIGNGDKTITYSFTKIK